MNDAIKKFYNRQCVSEEKLLTRRTITETSWQLKFMFKPNLKSTSFIFTLVMNINLCVNIWNEPGRVRGTVLKHYPCHETTRILIERWVRYLNTVKKGRMGGKNSVLF